MSFKLFILMRKLLILLIKTLGKIIIFPFVLLGFVCFLLIMLICRIEGLSEKDSIEIAKIR